MKPRIWRAVAFAALSMSRLGVCLAAENVDQRKPDTTTAKVELDDSQLDLVTAGTQSDVRELLRFDFSRTTSSGRTVRGDGSVELATPANQSNPSNQYTLMLGEGAQSNLKSLININAVNSQISVLLNLNISIDSTIGSINQFNIRAPSGAGTPGGN